MKMRPYYFVVAFVLAGIVLFGVFYWNINRQPSFECTDKIGCVTIEPEEPLKLGVLLDLSGGGKVFGQVQLNSIRIAMDDRGGQVLGHPVELLVLDEKCTPEDATTGMLRIVADPRIVGVIGTTCSGAAVAASKIMSEAGLVMISGSNSGISLTSIAGKRGENWQAGYFRTYPSQMLGTQMTALYAIQQLGITKAAIVDTDEIYNRGLAEAFKHTFTEQGGEIVIETEITRGEGNMLPVLTAISRSGAEALYIAQYPPDAIPLIKQARTMKELKNLIFLGAQSLLRQDFLDAVGKDGIGLYAPSSAPKLEGQAHDEFLSKYKQKHGAMPQTTLYSHAYDAVNVLLTAIESTAVTRGEGGKLHIGRQALRKAIYATSGFEGLSGRISCDAFGDCGPRGTTIIRLDDPSAGLEGFKSNIVYRITPKQSALSK